MENSLKATDGLWFLSTTIAYAFCISTFLLYVFNFDVDLTGSGEKGIFVILFTLSLVVAHNYRKVLNKNRSCKNLSNSEKSQDNSNADYILNNSQNKAGEKYPFPCKKKLSDICSKSCNRRNSFPMQSTEKFNFYCRSQIFSLDGEHDNSFKPDQKPAAMKIANGMKCENPVEIATILHNCVKQIGDVVQKVKYLNSTKDAIENLKRSELVSSIQSKELNLCRKYNRTSEAKCSLEQNLKKLEKIINMLNTASISSPGNQKDIITENISERKMDTASCSRALEYLEIGEFPSIDKIREKIATFYSNMAKVAEPKLILEPLNFERIEAGFSLIKTPKYKDTVFSHVQLSGLNVGKEQMFGSFFKPYNPEMPADETEDSEEQPLLKIPMRRSTSKFPKKRQEPIILKNTTTVLKNVANVFLHQRTV